jgi:hypothetical protein
MCSSAREYRSAVWLSGQPLVSFTGYHFKPEWAFQVWEINTASVNYLKDWSLARNDSMLFSVGFEVMKGCMSWDITPCNPLKVNKLFGWACRLHLQGRKVGRTRNLQESGWHTRIWTRVPLKRLVLFIRLHGVARGSIMVKALCYKPEGRGFEPRWGDFFKFT